MWLTLQINNEIEHEELHRICSSIEKLGYKVKHKIGGQIEISELPKEKKPKIVKKFTAKKTGKIKARNERAKQIQQETGCTYREALKLSSDEQRQENTGSLPVKNYSSAYNKTQKEEKQERAKEIQKEQGCSWHAAKIRASKELNKNDGRNFQDMSVEAELKEPEQKQLEKPEPNKSKYEVDYCDKCGKRIHIASADNPNVCVHCASKSKLRQIEDGEDYIDDDVCLGCGEKKDRRGNFCSKCKEAEQQAKGVAE